MRCKGSTLGAAPTGQRHPLGVCDVFSVMGGRESSSQLWGAGSRVLSYGGQGVEFCFIELGCCIVRWVFSVSARRSTSEVFYLGWAVCRCVDMCSSHKHALFEREH